jgi:hypothetical protein
MNICYLFTFIGLLRLRDHIENTVLSKQELDHEDIEEQRKIIAEYLNFVVQEYGLNLELKTNIFFRNKFN